MKYMIYCALIFTIACSNNSIKENNTEANTSTENKQADPSSSGSDNIHGEWELTGITEDTNGNNKLEPEERAKASTGAMDYMKLKSDGSAVFLFSKTEGRFEVKTNNTTGRRHLYLYDRSGFEYSKGFIMSVTNQELQIMHQSGGNSITIWKKL